jgi:hypothetical protein
MSEALEHALALIDAAAARRRPKPRPEAIAGQAPAADDRRERTRTVYVSPADPNWRGSESVVVRVLDRIDEPASLVVSGYDPFERGRF